MLINENKEVESVDCHDFDIKVKIELFVFPTAYTQFFDGTFLAQLCI